MEAQSGLHDLLARGRYDDDVFMGAFLDFYPHDGQRKWNANSTRKMNVLVPGNRWGKSVDTAAKHIKKAMYKVGDQWHRFHFGDKPFTNEQWTRAAYHTLNTSISADQAEIVFREAVALCQRPKIAPFIKGIYSTPFPRIEFHNGSVIHARSSSDNGKYIDGHRYAYISYDEAGWEPKLDWLLGTVLLTRLTDWGGNIDIIGTPKGRGYLYQLMMRGLNGDPDVYSQQGSTYENTYLAREEIEQMERMLSEISPKLARQAIHGDFVEVDGLCFTYDQLQGNLIRPEEFTVVKHQLTDGVEFMTEGFEPDPTRKYVAAFDLARKSDRTVGLVIDTTRFPGVICRGVQLTGASWEAQYEHIRRVASEHCCVPIIDATGVGDVVSEELEKRGIPHERFDFNDGRGIVKERLITNLQQALDAGRPPDGSDEEKEWGAFRCGLIPPLLEELSVYELQDKNLKTDWVMALAMAAWKAYRSSAGLHRSVPSRRAKTRRR